MDSSGDRMPLPDANKKSPRVYTLSQNTDLENIAFATLQSIGQPINIEEMNEDELRRLVLVNLARLAVKGEWDGLLSAGGATGSAFFLPSEDLITGEMYMLTMNAPYGASDTANYSVANEQARFGNFISPKSGTISEMEIYVSSAAASTCNMLVGIYSDSSGVPASLIAYATFDVTSTGYLTQTSFTGDALTLVAGTQYWIAYVRTASQAFSVTSQKKNHGPVYGIGASPSSMKYTVEVNSGESDNALPSTYPTGATTPQTTARLSLGVRF